MLCIGDLMLDDFVYGDVSRISPEAPAPVIAVSARGCHRRRRRQCRAQHRCLGARCIFVGVVGDDVPGTILRIELGPRQARDRIASAWSIASRPTTRKLRFVSEHYSTHLLRADWEVAQPVDAKTEAALIKQALALLPRRARWCCPTTPRAC